MIERDPLATLRAENARLIALLDGHGIEWRLPPEPTPTEPALPVPEPEPSRLSTAEKVALFRRLFRGRTDVYPIRWESKTTGKSGYAPACGVNGYRNPRKYGRTFFPGTKNALRYTTQTALKLGQGQAAALCRLAKRTLDVA